MATRSVVVEWQSEYLEILRQAARLIAYKSRRQARSSRVGSRSGFKVRLDPSAAGAKVRNLNLDLESWRYER